MILFSFLRVITIWVHAYACSKSLLQQIIICPCVVHMFVSFSCYSMYEVQRAASLHCSSNVQGDGAWDRHQEPFDIDCLLPSRVRNPPDTRTALQHIHIYYMYIYYYILGPLNWLSWKQLRRRADTRTASQHTPRVLSVARCSVMSWV